MTTKNFKVKNGIDIGEAISISDAGVIAGIDTDNLNEGTTNQYFTDARARQAISATDSGGDGGLSYDNSTGVITYTGPSATEVRAHFSGGTGVAITDGVVAIGQSVATTDDVVFDQVTATNVVTSTIAPSGSGNITLNTIDGGNVVTSRNFVDGAIRNANTQARGNIWELLATASGVNPTGQFTGVSIDNAGLETSKTAGLLIRNYGAAATARGRFIFERSRGTAAAPSALLIGDFLGEVDVTGYTTAGWLNDLVAAVPAFYGFNATENWTGINNCGTQLTIALQPTATTLATGSQVTCLGLNPQAGTFRSDSMVMMQGKTTGFVATGSSISGTTLTIGTVTSGTVATGQMIQNAANTIASNTYIVSGSGNTWTLNQAPGNQSNQTISGRQGFISSVGTNTTIVNDLRLFTNTVNNAAGAAQVTLSNNRSTLALVGDTVTVDTVSGNDMLVLKPNNTIISSNTVSLKDSSQVALPGGKIDYRRTFGCFHKLADVTAPAADTIYAFDWTTDTTAHVNTQGVTVSNTSRLNIDTQGSYNVILEMHVQNTDNADRVAYIWLAKNGTDLAETCIKAVLTKDTSTIITKDWLVDGIAANDYLEVRFAVDNISGISLQYEPSQTTPYLRPAVASATITIEPVGA